MTPEDRALDPSLLLDKSPIILYRLARARFANLSGIGAALTPGRWNAPGQEAIYTSTEAGVPLLERLVHTPKDLIPSNLALMKFRLTGSWDDGFIDPDASFNGLIDPKTRGSFWFYSTLAAARDPSGGLHEMYSVLRRIELEPLAMAVPSVIVPVWNVVLYPGAPAFWNHVHLESIEPFEFDPRLFPEEAQRET